MLRLNELYKGYSGREAVRGISLEIRRGEVFGLLGPNGAGKSTTIGMTVGLLKPDSGTVRILSGDEELAPDHPASRQHFGVAPQSLSLYELLTGEENLQLFGKLYGLRGPALLQRVDEVLDGVGLTERRRTRVSTYSGGMKRRLNLAVAMIHDPPLLLLDEPTVGVDPQSRHAIFELMEGLRARGRTILYTTHYMEEAQRLCDRVGILDHGKLLAVDTVDALIRTHGGRSVLMIDREGEQHRIETDDPLRELAPIMQAGGASNIRIVRPDLESVFLKLTGRSLRD